MDFEMSEEGELLKATVLSLNKDDGGLEFYRDGLLSVTEQYLTNDRQREVFRKANGFNLLTRNPGVSAVLAKTVETMQNDELPVLKAVYTLCYAAANGYKDNAIRSLQIRGVVDNVFQMISTEREVPKDVKMEGLRYMDVVTRDPNVCKLLCNKYDFSEIEEFVSDFGTTQHKIRANMYRLCRCGEDPEVQEACFKVLANLASCPRLHRHVVEANKPQNIEKLVDAIEEAIEKGSEQPESFGAFGRALLRLCLHDKVRRELAGRRTFPAKCVIAVEGLMDERSPEGNDALASLLRVIATVCFDLPDDCAEEARLKELSGEIEASTRPALVRRWSRALYTALCMRSEDAKTKFAHSLQMFYEHYDALVNTSEDYTEPSRTIDFKDLQTKLMGPEWRDVPFILFAGALQVLGEAIDTPEKRKRFKAEKGFELMTRHQIIPHTMRRPLSSMNTETFLMMGIYKLGLSICKESRENTVRFIQMPNVLDHAIELLSKPVDYHPAMLGPALEALDTVSKNPDVCKLVCNKHDLSPHMHHLFDMEKDWSDDILELRGKVLVDFARCPKLVWRLAFEKNLPMLINQIEEAIPNGWNRPIIFRYLLKAVYHLAVNVRLQNRTFHTPAMFDALLAAFSILLSFGPDIPDLQAAINLVDFSAVLLHRRPNSDVIEVMKTLMEMDELPSELLYAVGKHLGQLRY